MKMFRKRASSFFVAIAIMLSFTVGCSSGDTTKQDNEPIILTASAELHDENIAGDVPLFSTEPVSCGDCSVSIVGITFTKSSGDAVQDAMLIGNGLDTAFVDATKRGFDIGFMDSSNKEVAKRDAYLCLYLKYSFAGEASQRDSVIPDLDVTVTDHENEQFILIHNSMDETYVNVDYPYGIIILKGYSDSEHVMIKLNDVCYQLDLRESFEP